MVNSKNFYSNLLFREYKMETGALALYRIFFAALYLLFLGIPSFSWLSEVPDFFYSPQSFNIARWVAKGIPPKFILLCLDFSLLFLMACILFGYKTKTTALSFSLLLIVGFSMKFSLGKIGHGILFVILPGILAFSNWGNKFSLDARSAKNTNQSSDGYIPFIAALVIGFAMFTAGIGKIDGGWLSLSRYGSLHHFSYQHLFHNADAYLAPVIAEGMPSYAWKTMDYVTVGFELLFLPAVLNKKVFQYFCAGAIFFHLATLLIFNIGYVNNLLAYLLFIRWDSILEFLKSKQIIGKIQKLFSTKNFLLVLLLFTIQHILIIFLFHEYLIRNKLISPISWLSIYTDYEFRYFREVILIPLSILVLLTQFFLPKVKDQQRIA